MSAHSFLFNVHVIVVSAIVGLLAGQIFRRGSLGFPGDIAAGLIGGLSASCRMIGGDLRDAGPAVGIATCLGSVILLGLSLGRTLRTPLTGSGQQSKVSRCAEFAAHKGCFVFSP